MQPIVDPSARPRSWSAWATPDGPPAEARQSLFAAHPELLACTRAALELGIEWASFLHVPDESGVWLQVVIESSPAREGDPLGHSAEAECVAEEREPPFGLTVRELDVLTMLTAGLSNADIAARFGVRPRTVGTHVEHILAKLDQSTRSGAAAVAAIHSLIRLPLPQAGNSLRGLPAGRINEALTRGTDGMRAAPGSSVGVRRTKGSLKIGCAYPVLGANGDDGRDMHRGALLAAAEINARGGIAGRRLEIVLAPMDAWDAGSAIEAIRRLAGLDVDAISSGYVLARGSMLDMARVAASYARPFLHVLCAQEVVDAVREAPDEMGGVFQVCPSLRFYGDGFVRFAAELATDGVLRDRRIMFLESGAPLTGCTTIETFDEAERLGCVIDTARQVEQTTEAWRLAAMDVRARAPGAVMVSPFREDLLLAFLTELRRDPPPTMVYVCWTPAQAGFVERAGDLAEDVVWSSTISRYEDAMGESFERRFRAAFGRAPGRASAGIQYDSVQLIARAWSAVGGARPDDRVRAALRGEVARGVNGTYYFDTPGQCALGYPDVSTDPSLAQAHLIHQIQGGEHRIVGPRPYGTTRFRRQSWMEPASVT